jgi:hypothetical protein
MEFVKTAEPTQELTSVEKYAGQMSALQLKNFKQMDRVSIVNNTQELMRLVKFVYQMSVH